MYAFTPSLAFGRRLGLTIVQALLRAHHADIEHRPTPKGACFAIVFRQ